MDLEDIDKMKNSMVSLLKESENQIRSIDRQLKGTLKFNQSSKHLFEKEGGSQERGREKGPTLSDFLKIGKEKEDFRDQL